MTDIRRVLDRWWFAALALLLLATRTCHLRILWAEESYPAAAAIQMLHRQVIYRDFWYDKPPLTPLVYLLWGAWPGWPLRLAGTIFAVLVCRVAYQMASSVWSRREGIAAAWLMAFFLTFDIPSSVATVAPDLLMVLPHLAAVYCAWRGRAVAAGALAGVCFLANPKGAMVALVCLLWLHRSIPKFVIGFVLANAAMLAGLVLSGAARGYWEQVWRWGLLYAGDTFVADPLKEGLLRTGNWVGFHAALAIGGAAYWWRERNPGARRTIVWAALSLVAVAGGLRFFPRYYFQLLPVMVLVAARGWVLLGRWRAVMLVALLIPAVRFGPRYGILAADLLAGREHHWADLAMNQDSRRVSADLLSRARPGQTLLVWGYRPDIWVYTRMPSGTFWLDSQPLTGVIADRHLTAAHASAPWFAWDNRGHMQNMHPDFVIDGLGPYNPRLAITAYPDLRPWLAQYSGLFSTGGSVLYQRTPVTAPSSRVLASPEKR
ncbi:MAG: hypothetical protein NTY38_32325 [Acidobacteria bacterium]|nr:hypothetical protein [Acidobacteriota bacterium]